MKSSYQFIPALSLIFIVQAVFLTFTSKAMGEDTLHVWVLSVDKPTGLVEVGGVDSAGPSGRIIGNFTWEWGDGTANRGWFPQTHVYTNTNVNYIVRVTSHYTDGTMDHEEIFVEFGSYPRASEPSPIVEINVSDLNMPDNNLKAAILSSLRLTGAPVITQADLQCLTELRANNGAISDLTGLDQYGDNLISADFGRNQISDISILVLLNNLTSLSLSQNPIEDISLLAGLPQLVSLDISGMPITDYSVLYNLPNLISLELNNNGIRDISFLSGLTNLTSLGLMRNEITDISPLSGLTHLNILHLGWNEIADMSSLLSLTNLTGLSLRNNPIANVALVANLSNLTYLYLEGYAITDITFLLNLTNLTDLILWRCQLSDISPLASLTNLNDLSLGYNQITNISSLAGLADLTWLDLRENQIVNISPLVGLSNLVSLYLNSNKISNISFLLGYTNLRRLVLDDNRLNEEAYTTDIPLIEQNNPLNWYFSYDQALIVSPGGGGFATIQEAIDTFDPNISDTIIVTEGVYTGPGNTNLDFQGKSLKLYGENGPKNCEIFCDDQSRALYFHNDENASSVIRGFTLTGGTNVAGSAVYCEGASPTLDDCIIKGNGSNVIWVSDILNLQGTVQIKSGSVDGPGFVLVPDDAILQTQDCSIHSSVLGAGLMNVLSGYETTLAGSSLVSLGQSKNDRGQILCYGELVVQEEATIQNTIVEVAASGTIQVIDQGNLLNCEIRTTSNNAIIFDPQTHTGSLAETDLVLVLNQDTDLEIRGQMYCSDPENPLCGLGGHQLDAVPALDVFTMTISRLEVRPNVNVTLVDHLHDHPGNSYDVLYVRDLVLAEGAQLNLAGQRLYYETLTADADQIVDLPIYTSNLAEVNLNDPNTFDNAVTTNNTPELTFVELVDVPDIAPEPVMHLQSQVSQPARAKTYLGQFSEDEVVVNFSYLFNTDQAGVILEVYLSDQQGLLPLNDPHMLLAGQIQPPILGCPGSFGSDLFATYTLPVNVSSLDPNQGLWLELILSEPTPVLQGFQTMGVVLPAAVPSQGGAYAQDLTLSSMCLNICMDLTKDGVVTPEDYTLVSAGCGRSVDRDTPQTSPLSCIDRGYSQDGYADVSDLVNWGDLMGRCGSSDIKNLCSIPMVWEGTVAQANTSFISYGITAPMAAPAAVINSNLLILGKGSTFIGNQEFIAHEDLLFGFDDVGASSQEYTLSNNQGQMRLIQGEAGDVLILDSDRGLCQLNGTVIIGPSQRLFDGKTVTLGVEQGFDQRLRGRPLRDVLFHNGFVYVVPVIVQDSNDVIYQAGAKLALTGDDYVIEQLYYDPDLASISDQSPNLRGLRGIALDDDGRVYLLNAFNQNKSNMLWAFRNNGALQKRHFLDRLPEPIKNPAGLCYDTDSDRLYIASGVFDQTQPNQSVLYGFKNWVVLSQDTLVVSHKIEIGNLQHVTGLSSDGEGTLWVTGFTLNKSPEHLYAYDLPYALPGPRLAEASTAGLRDSHIDAISLYGTMTINLPTSVLWVEP